MSKFAFGIDLGTTNSCIAVMKGASEGKLVPQIIPFPNGKTTIPSCVMFKQLPKRISIVVGKEAYDNRFSKDVIYSSKRHIGTDKVYTVLNGKLEVTPGDVATTILKELKHNAERLYGEGNVVDVVITVPAYFNHTKRKETAFAARQAGLNVLSIINEPTAAALAYSLHEKDTERFLVYDLGGGTFDVTLMDLIGTNDQTFDIFEDDSEDDKLAKVLFTVGDDMLGGDDLDSAILDVAFKDVNEEMKSLYKISHYDIRKKLSSEEYEKCLLMVENYKKTRPDSTIIKELKLEHPTTKKPVSIRISSKEVEKALQPLYARTKAKIDECLKVRENTVTKMILVGGSTKLEMLREMLREDYPKLEIYCGLNPDEAVALGAAVQASILKGETAMTVSDVLPQSIGIDCHMDMNGTRISNRFKKLITKDTVLPAEVTTIVTSIEDNQKEVTVAFYQGEEPNSLNNSYLGSVTISDVELDKKGEDTIKLILHVNASGVLSVDLSTGGKTISKQITNVLKADSSDKPVLPKIVLKQLNSLTSCVNNAPNLSDEEKGALLDEIESHMNDGAKNVAKLSARIRELTKDSVKEQLFNATTHFVQHAAVNVSGVVGEEDEEEE